MASIDDLEIVVYDGAFQRQGAVTDPVSVTGTVRHNAGDAWQLVLDAGDPIGEALQQPGARIAVAHRGVPISSAVAQDASGPIVFGDEHVTVTLQGDWRWMQNTVALVRPNGDLEATSLEAIDPDALGQAWLPGGGADAGQNGTTQGQYGYLLWPDGSAAHGGVNVQTAEAAVKWVTRANFARLGRPAIFAPDLGRGGDARDAGILPAVRFWTLEEAVAPILAWSGLQLTLIHEAGGSGVTVDVRETGSWPAVLTAESGIIQGGRWKRNAPTSTRAIVGGPGEEVDRVILGVPDTTGREAEWHDVIETFRDATGASPKWPGSVADAYRVPKYFALRPEPSSYQKSQLRRYMQDAGRKSIDEGQPTSSVQANLAESEGFYFGGLDGVRLGDAVRISAGGQIFANRILEVDFAMTRADGLQVTPILGERIERGRTQARAIAALGASMRRLAADK